MLSSSFATSRHTKLAGEDMHDAQAKGILSARVYTAAAKQLVLVRPLTSSWKHLNKRTHKHPSLRHPGTFVSFRWHIKMVITRFTQRQAPENHQEMHPVHALQKIGRKYELGGVIVKRCHTHRNVNSRVNFSFFRIALVKSRVSWHFSIARHCPVPSRIGGPRSFQDTRGRTPLDILPLSDDPR